MPRTDHRLVDRYLPDRLRLDCFSRQRLIAFIENNAAGNIYHMLVLIDGHQTTSLRRYQRRSNRLRRMTATAFISSRKPSNTIMAPEVRSTKARSGLCAHR